MQGKRLDYIFFRKPNYRLPSSSSTSPPIPELLCTQSQVVLTSLVPGQNFSYSDHFGIEATIEILYSHSPSSSSPIPHDYTNELLHNAFSNSSPSSASHKSGIPLHSYEPKQPLSTASFHTILHSLTIAYRHAKRRYKVHLAMSAGLLLGAIAVMVGSAWLPNASWSPLAVLVAVVLGWGATTLFYNGYVF